MDRIGNESVFFNELHSGEDRGQAALLPAAIEGKRTRWFWNNRP
jgi:hypothetical protein